MGTEIYRDDYDYDMAERMRRIAVLAMYKDIAKEVVDGRWGNGMKRIEKLETAGYDSAKVQNIVNVMLMEGKNNGR